jgi:hypothetical protein
MPNQPSEVQEPLQEAFLGRFAVDGEDGVGDLGPLDHRVYDRAGPRDEGGGAAGPGARGLPRGPRPATRWPASWRSNAF